MNPRERALLAKGARLQAAKTKQAEEELRKAQEQIARLKTQVALSGDDSAKVSKGDRMRAGLTSDDELRALFWESGNRIPIRLGNLFGPEGNVFNVIGAVADALKWGEAQKLPRTQEQADTYNEYRKRTYVDTLKMIQTHFVDLDDAIQPMLDWFSREVESGPEPPKRRDTLGRHGDNPIGGFLGPSSGPAKRR